MAQINWTSQALQDLGLIAEFIGRDAPSFAQVIVDRVFESVERLESFPRSGRVVPEINQENIREIIWGSYRIVYLLRQEEVFILTVFHGSRLLSLGTLAKDLE
jgi:addiction module RelE/StbE family toxin